MFSFNSESVDRYAATPPPADTKAAMIAMAPPIFQ
jgi:hypothetical protein